MKHIPSILILALASEGHYQPVYTQTHYDLLLKGAAMQLNRMGYHMVEGTA